jgi:hypothetical protein
MRPLFVGRRGGLMRQGALYWIQSFMQQQGKLVDDLDEKKYTEPDVFKIKDYKHIAELCYNVLKTST